MISMDEMAEAARLLLDAEAETAKAEQALKDKKEAERKLREETVPGMFAELGIEKLVLNDGSVFSCTQEVYCAIPAERREEAYAWCEKNGFGGLIKTEVQIPFGKGQLEQAFELIDKLVSELGVDNAVIERSIHPQTLKAFLKERIGAEQESAAIEAEADEAEGVDASVRIADMGEELPVVEKIDLELFGARPVMVAKVKSSKKKGPHPAARGQVGGGQVHHVS